MDNLYLVIRNDIIEAWNAGWTHADVPVLWRSNEAVPQVDPFGRGRGTPHFLRNEIDFGREELAAYGGGRGANLRTQYGSLIIRAFSSTAIGDEDEALRLLSDSTAIFRGYRVQDQQGGDLSFIGTGSGFDWGPTEDGVWFMRGYLTVFEYRFPG
jgi:hypothetical protein